MPTYLDLLPDELYQKIMSPLFAQCAEEVAHKRNISYNHRTLQGCHTYDAYEELFAGNKSRSHLAVVYAWLVWQRPPRFGRLTPDPTSGTSHERPLGRCAPLRRPGAALLHLGGHGGPSVVKLSFFDDGPA